MHVGPLDGYMGAGVKRTTVSRLEGLRSIGLKVVPFDSSGCLGTGRWEQRINYRLYAGAAVRQMNRDLIRVVREVNPDAVWIDAGLWVYPRTLKKLKRWSKYLVHYYTDDLFGGGYAWLHRAGIKFYDLYVTTNRWNVSEVRRRYGVKSMRAGMGYDSAKHRQGSGCSLATSDVCPVVFIGHWEPHSESYIRALKTAGCPVHVWGTQWWKASTRTLRSIEVLPPEQYVPILSSAEIALCFLSHRNRNESTERSFEIPAIGTFFLAQRTAEHEYFFGDGIGAALFSDPQELIEKVKYYRSHPEARQRIATVGHQRCKELGLSWQELMRREWPLIEAALESGGTTLDGKAADAPFWPGFRSGHPAPRAEDQNTVRLG